MVKQKEQENKEKIEGKKQYELNMYKKVTEDNKLLHELKKEIERKEKLMEDKIDKESQKIFEKMEYDRKRVKHKVNGLEANNKNILLEISRKKDNDIKEIDVTMVNNIKSFVEM